MLRKIKYPEKGIIITVVVSCLIVFVLFGDIISHLNSRHFGGNGDGLKAYYGAEYHVKHDSSYLHFEGMNYPYGEHVFFTGNQNVITNTIKFIKPVIDLSDYTVGIMNGVMLGSIILCALLLYLIFKELKIKMVYAIVAAIGIAFLSPQLERLLGHYTLSYVFVIPFIIYQLIRYEKERSWEYTIYLSIGLILLILMHPYFFPIAAILVISQFIVLLYHEKENRAVISKITHLFVQLILPILVFQLILSLTNSVDDRTALPWGFWEYTSNSTGVFFPFGKPYEWIFHLIAKPLEISWEGIAYVGLMAILVLVAMLVRFIWKIVIVLIKKENSKNGIYFSSARITLIWLTLAGVLGMAVSFAFPFNLGLEDWVDSFGFIKQFRSIGRLNWIFFYTFNIVAVYWLIHHLKNKGAVLKYALISLATIFLFLDAWYQTSPIPNKLNNENPSFSDYNFELEENTWIKQIEIDKYQAIMPLPYFHVGSENILAFGAEQHRKYVFNISLITGLPTTGSYFSRTSVSQSINNVQLHQRPYKKPKVLGDFKSKKPLLIIADANSMSGDEKQIVNGAKLIGANASFQFYEIGFESLSNLWKKAKREVNQEISGLNVEKGTPYAPDSTGFKFDGFENESSDGYYNNGSILEEIKEVNLVNKVKFDWLKEGQEFTVSFWVNHIEKDLMLRSGMEVREINDKGEEVKIDYRSLGDHIRAIDDTWGLFEVNFMAYPDQEFVFYYKNVELKEKENVEIDNFLLRHANTDVYLKADDYYMKNNRYYSN